MIPCQDPGRFWVGEFSFEHDGCSEGAATGALDSNKRAFYRDDTSTWVVTHYFVPVADLDACGLNSGEDGLPSSHGHICMAFSGGFLTLRPLPGRPILLALDANIVGREELSPPNTKRLIPSPI